MLSVLGVSALLFASLSAEAAVQLVDQKLSVNTARDGQTITFRYQIQSDQTGPAWLGAFLISPSSQMIEDSYQESENRNRVQLKVGTHWYESPFLINLPPSPPYGAYSAQWELSGENSVFASERRNDVLTLLEPVPVTVAILMYHKVGDVAHSEFWVSAEQLESHIRALRAHGYTLVSMSDVADYRAGIRTPPAKPVAITFDDGYEDLVTHVLPIISKPDLQVPVTAFVNPGLFGKVNDWDMNLDFNQEPKVKHLTLAQTHQLQNSGLVDIQSHTLTHANLLSVTQPERISELKQAREALEQELNKRILFLAYPWGSGATHPTVQGDVHDTGYMLAAAINQVPETKAREKYALYRHDIHSGVTAEPNPSHPEDYLFGPHLLNESNQPPAGDHHPADGNHNLTIDSLEMSAYAAAWLNNQHNQADYLTQAAEIWLRGGKYTINPSASGSNKWAIAP